MSEFCYYESASEFQKQYPIDCQRGISEENFDTLKWEQEIHFWMCVIKATALKMIPPFFLEDTPKNPFLYGNESLQTKLFQENLLDENSMWRIEGMQLIQREKESKKILFVLSFFGNLHNGRNWWVYDEEKGVSKKTHEILYKLENAFDWRRTGMPPKQESQKIILETPRKCEESVNKNS